MTSRLDELCVRCGASLCPPIPAVCPRCEGAPRLDGRYALLEVLGRSAERTTYRARRVADGREVAIKELLLRRMQAWKSEELFAREIRILREIDHRSVPRLIDTLDVHDGPRSGVYLVRELIEGRSLEAEMRARPHAPAEVASVLSELLGIVADLHALSPPVVHRDLTLSNVLRRTDGRLVLVDLGAVMDALASAVGGSTLVGTYGYVAPEQLRGAASPASDVYACAAIGLALLARRPAHELLDARHRFDTAAYARGGMRALLDRMLAPELGARPSARDAARAMRELASGREPRTSPMPLVMGATAIALAVGLPFAWGSDRAAEHFAAPPVEPSPPVPATVAPSPSLPSVVAPSPGIDPPTPLGLASGWSPACEARHACIPVTTSFAGVTLADQCTPILPVGDAPAESRASAHVTRTFGGVAFSCETSQQSGSFCNMLCTASSTDGWADVEPVVRWIGDRHGRPARAEESTTAWGLGRTNRRRTWTFQAPDAGLLAPEVLVLVDRLLVGDASSTQRVGPEVVASETITVSYRGMFSRTAR